MSAREYRAHRDIGFRVVGDGSARQAWATVCTYGKVDDYGSVWEPGCWKESLEAKLPKVTWGHDWLDLIGRVTDYRDSKETLDLELQFSDFDAVPRARQAWTQLRDGDIDEFSFGFERKEWTTIDAEGESKALPGATERIVRATMFETSPVLRGAVPGTKVLSVRAPARRRLEGQVDVKVVLELARRLAAGEIDEAEAIEAVHEASAGAPVIVTPSVPAPADPEAVEALMAALDLEAGAALDLAGRTWPFV